jgi:hypothetical protein
MLKASQDLPKLNSPKPEHSFVRMHYPPSLESGGCTLHALPPINPVRWVYTACNQRANTCKV